MLYSKRPTAEGKSETRAPRVRTMDQPKGPLLLCQWDRVILDEGHEIRNHKTHTNYSCCSLLAKYRWVLTGTPIQNRPQDYFALLKFLRYKPYDQYELWSQFIEKVVLSTRGVAQERSFGDGIVLT